MVSYTPSPERRYRRIKDATGLSDGEFVAVAATVRFLAGFDDDTAERICRLLTTVRASERRGLF